MKQGISIVMCLMVVCMCVMFTGCGGSAGDTKELSGQELDQHTNSSVSEAGDNSDVVPEISTSVNLNDESLYYVSVDGKQVRAGMKLFEVFGMGFKVINGQQLIDTSLEAEDSEIVDLYYEGDKVLFVTIWNPTEDAQEMLNCTVESVTVLDYLEHKDASIVGGLKIGSSVDDVVSVFGECADTYEEKYLSYTYRHPDDQHTGVVFKFTDGYVSTMNVSSRLILSDVQYTGSISAQEINAN